MVIRILGSGCTICSNLEKTLYEVLKEQKIDAIVEKAADFKTIAEYHVMSTPALVINEVIVSMGRSLTKDEVRRLIRAHLQMIPSGLKKCFII